MSQSPSEGKPRIRSLGHGMSILARGMLMGASDLVPGFSGGTTAFITGIYPDLMKSLVSFDAAAFALLVGGEGRQFLQRVAWEFLLTLVIGIAVAIASLAGVIHAILNEPLSRSLFYAGFVGLVLASVRICLRLVRAWSPSVCLALVLGGLFAFATVWFPAVPTTEASLYDIELPASSLPTAARLEIAANYDFEQQRLLGVAHPIASSMLARGLISPDTTAYSHVHAKSGALQEFVEAQSQFPLDLWILACGFVAIIALLLPGISGSYLLVVLGVYPIVVGATSDLVASVTRGSFDTDAFFILLSLLCGIALGIASFARVVHWLLERYHDPVVAAMVGFMAGALPAIWPFWSYTYLLSPLRLQDGPRLELLARVWPDLGEWHFWLALLCGAAGFALVTVVEIVCQRSQRQSIQAQKA